MSGAVDSDKKHTEEPEVDPDTPRAILEEELDKEDYEIFTALNENGRMSDTELAERVGLSRTAVRRRRENLSESGVLEILAVLVLQETDLAYADVRVTVDKSVPAEQRDGLIHALIDADLVYSVDSCLGEYDLFVRTWHASLSEVKSYIWDLLDEHDAVSGYDITPIVKTWKAWDRTLARPE